MSSILFFKSWGIFTISTVLIMSIGIFGLDYSNKYSYINKIFEHIIELGLLIFKINVIFLFIFLIFFISGYPYEI